MKLGELIGVGYLNASLSDNTGMTKQQHDKMLSIFFIETNYISRVRVLDNKNNYRCFKHGIWKKDLFHSCGKYNVRLVHIISSLCPPLLF